MLGPMPFACNKEWFQKIKIKIINQASYWSPRKKTQFRLKIHTKLSQTLNIESLTENNSSDIMSFHTWKSFRSFSTISRSACLRETRPRDGNRVAAASDVTLTLTALGDRTDRFFLRTVRR